MPGNDRGAFGKRGEGDIPANRRTSCGAHAVLSNDDSGSSMSVISDSEEMEIRAFPLSSVTKLPSLHASSYTTSTIPQRAASGQSALPSPPPHHHQPQALMHVMNGVGSASTQDGVSVSSITSPGRPASAFANSTIPRRKLRDAEVSFVEVPRIARHPHTAAGSTSVSPAQQPLSHSSSGANGNNLPGNPGALRGPTAGSNTAAETSSQVTHGASSSTAATGMASAALPSGTTDMMQDTAVSGTANTFPHNVSMTMDSSTRGNAYNDMPAWSNRSMAPNTQSIAPKADSCASEFYEATEDPRYSFDLCHIPLNVAVMFNVVITVTLVAVLSIFPLNTVSMRSMEHVTTTLSLSLANTLAQSINANFFFLPLSVKNFVSAWMLDRDRQSWPWTQLDMPQAMQQICEMVGVSSTSHLLYLYISSPISGYGAYCSPQYSDDYLVGKFNVHNETDYRYLIDPYTLQYAVPNELYCPVQRMNEWEYTVDFGADDNPWHHVALPWYERYLESGNASLESSDGWWVFTVEGLSVVTYSFPFIDYEGNLAIVSGALQPASVRVVFPSGLVSADDIGRAMVVDPVTGLVFISSWRNEPPMTMDNWNESCLNNSGIQPTHGRYLDNITDPLMYDAIVHLGGQAGLLNTPLEVKRWQVRFTSRGSAALAIATRVSVSSLPEVNINLLVIYAITRNEYTENIDTVRTAVIISVVVILVIIALVDLVLIYMFLQPLRDVAAGLHAAAQLRDGGEAVEGRISIIKEVADMQYNFKILNAQLMRMKSFLPQGVLGPVGFWSGSEGGGSEFEDSMTGEGRMFDDGEDFGDGAEGAGGAGRRHIHDAGDLHLNERVLLDEVNKFRRRYCTVLVVCLHIKESEGLQTHAEPLITCFMEAVIPIALKHGGIIEVQRPDYVVISFGAHNRIALHHMRGAKCALEIMQCVNSTMIGPRVCCMADCSEYYVGTCGAAQRNARVAYTNHMPMQTEVLKLSKSLNAQILLTQRLASSLDEAMLSIPIDCVVYTLRTQSNKIYELRGTIKSLAPYISPEEARLLMRNVRNAFNDMSSGDYASALTAIEQYENRDGQVTRLILACRALLHRGISKPFIRTIGRVKFTEAQVDYDEQGIRNWRDGGDDQNRASLLGYTNGMYGQMRMPAEAQVLIPGRSPPLADMDAYTALFNPCAGAASTKLIEGTDINATEEDGKDNGDGALFEMFIDADDDDDMCSNFLQNTVTVSTNSDGPLVNVCTKGEVGELPMAFVDFEGNTWSRSADQLGTGAFSTVYRGLSDSGNLVALKCFQLRARNIDYNAITDEVRVFASLHHENIVQYISVFVSENHFIEIMELVPGGSLDALLKSFGKLSVPAVKRYLRDVLRGLSYLHSMGIVHCDIKPHNMLLAMDGQCKLSDFGSAIAHATTSVCNIDDVLEMRGTPGYMAPEVVLGALPMAPSDVFSLGVGLLEMLTGKLPWDYVDAGTLQKNQPHKKRQSAPPKPHLRNSIRNGHAVGAAQVGTSNSAGAFCGGEGSTPVVVAPHSPHQMPFVSPLLADLDQLDAEDEQQRSPRTYVVGGGGDSGACAKEGSRSGLELAGSGLATAARSTSPLIPTGGYSDAGAAACDMDGGSAEKGGGGDESDEEKNELNESSTTHYRRPIENIMRNPTQLILHIGKGLIVPHIPDTLDADAVDFLSKCIHPDPTKRATVQELSSHRWLL